MRLDSAAIVRGVSLAVLSTLLLLLPFAAQARILRWTSAGLAAQDITALAIDPLASPSGVVYAAADGSGVFMTASGGASWTPINSGLGDLSVTALAIVYAPPPLCPSPCKAPLFAATSYSGVFRRFDSTWEAASNGLTNLRVMSLANSSFDGFLYAATLGGGVFRSNDYGTTWTAVNTGLTSLRVRTLAAVPDSASLFAGTDGGTFKSTDSGTTWVLTFPTAIFRFDATALAVDLSSASTIYAADILNCSFPCGVPAFPALYRSTNGGATWTNIDAGLINKFVRALAVSRSAPSTVWAGTSGGGVFESANRGDTWTAVNDGLGNLFMMAFAVDPSGRQALIAGTFGGGVYRAVFDGGCASGATSLCLNNARFNVQVTWRVPSQGTSGAGMAVPMTGDTGYFWFFTSNNVELVVKVVDGRAFNNKFWVFYGALSNVEYTITVTDTQTGAVKTYVNPSGQLASVADTAAF